MHDPKCTFDLDVKCERYPVPGTHRCLAHQFVWSVVRENDEEPLSVQMDMKGAILAAKHISLHNNGGDDTYVIYRTTTGISSDDDRMVMNFQL